MLWVSLFVFIALFLLRPYGMHVQGNLFLTCLGYGLVTFGVAVVYSFTTTRIFGWKKCGDNWTLWKWIVDSILLLACISVGNFIFYNFTVGWTAFEPFVLATITIPTVTIGLFPVAFSGMAVQLRAERKNQREAGLISLTPKTPLAPAAAPHLLALSGTFSVDPTALLFCESRQNYVRCVYLREGIVAEETIRATLSGLETELVGHRLLRCHRSYLINPDHIREARGNAQGLKLSMIGTEEEVPVARAYVSLLRLKLEQ
jgi:hypothetical protein